MGHVTFEVSLWAVSVEMSGRWLGVGCVTYLLLRSTLLKNLAADLC